MEAYNYIVVVCNFDAEKMSEQKLRKLFEPYGEILAIDMELSNQPEQAFIAFTSLESVTQACAQMDGYSLDDKKLLVFIHKSSMKALVREMKGRGRALCFWEAAVSKREDEAEKIVGRLEPLVENVNDEMTHLGERVKHHASDS